MCLWPRLLIRESSCKRAINLACLENTDEPLGLELVTRLVVNNEPFFKMSLDKCVARLHGTARTSTMGDKSRQKENKTKAKFYKADQ